MAGEGQFVVTDTIVAARSVVVDDQHVRDAGIAGDRLRARSTLGQRGDHDRRLAVVDDVCEFLRGEVRVHARVEQPGSFAGGARLEVPIVVLHEDRVVTEPLHTDAPEQMGELVRPCLVLAVRHCLAGRRHDERGAVGMILCVISWIHANSLCRSVSVRTVPRHRSSEQLSTLHTIAPCPTWLKTAEEGPKVPSPRWTTRAESEA